MNTSRRTFLAQILAATTGISGSSCFANVSRGANSTYSLQLAGYTFPRFEALARGQIEIDGFDYRFAKGAIGDLNTDTLSGGQIYDITEIGLHPFMLAYANDDFRDYKLLPIHALRVFRHKSIFIRTDRGVQSPADLKGKRIATPGYSSTSLTWIRGILKDEYGIEPSDVEWVVSNKDSSSEAAGKVSAQENVYPDGLTVVDGPAGLDESDLLEQGQVDALFHAAVPRCFVQGHPKVRRLFDDSRAVEQAYYAKTGIFPIMHVVAMRKSLIERYPGLALKVCHAYSAAKQHAYRKMQSIGWGSDMLPWYSQEMETSQDVMGENFYSYGMNPKNRRALETLFRYSVEQGLAQRLLTVQELFAEETLNYVE
ncbi:ABC transporter substrate-binding protein [Coraliomargarita akajimensis]|uniref:4,5-dihydroxyphthalate decarboxylase n=1 Tax=Coraliomargarita akajimensis (strain DSM 45221 / IAM 15411 / JCM 23193 / KCTC 12865 / 04OKA010-24) TaxID=583355 RepID=D5EPW9_CORAD|nr:ABC transporter substrate-binding protein [Coraliomargarita akajimensis]ADE55702.1 4,5-dihydroxyphthalate decarboxylase [Coraliomargarita akajimensis DSM 45221]